MVEIKKIVLTGGPCAGKTTAISWIQNYFGKLGYKLLFVNESATELINNGVTPRESQSMIDFQTLLMKNQIFKEDIIQESIKFTGYNKYLIVCDRGIFDNKAYMTNESFNKCLENNGLNVEEAMARYDAVFHLVSAAKGAESFYNHDNAARSENIQQAQKLDDDTLHAWIGHPHLRVIDNNQCFEEKMKSLMREISSILEIPYTYEIERKFLIKKPDIEMLEKLDNCQKVSIIQTYLYSNDSTERRIRQRGINGNYTYTLTTKSNINGIKRIETEKKLTEKEYLKELMNADTSLSQIRKDRYCLMHDNAYFEIDIYPNMEEEAILEIELCSEHDSIKIPNFIEVIDEVTDNYEYRNKSLARKLVKR